MSVHNQFGRLSPPPFYHHSPHTDNAPPTSLSFMLSPTVPPVNPYPSSNKVGDDTYYMAKYKDMKRKVKEIELDNDKLHLKCLKARKNIQRLRLERAILYERLSSISPADSNAFPEVAVRHPGTDFYTSPDPPQGQERYHQPPFSPEIQARLHADQSREIPYQARSHHPQSSIPGADPPLRPLEDPAFAYQSLCGPGCLPPKPRQRRLKLDPKGEKSQAYASNTRQEVRNGGTSPHRVFPFVHEYSNRQAQGERLVLPPQEYPSEIRFHQYEASPERRPVTRTRREIDREAEKASKHSKRRPTQEGEKDQRRHLRSRSRSPIGHASPHGTYVYPVQNSFTSSERDSQSYPFQDDNSDQQPAVTTERYSNESSQQHAAESRGREGREGDMAYPRPQEHHASAERVKVQDNHRQLRPEKKKKGIQSQMEQEELLARERDERDGYDRGHRGLPRGVSGVESVYNLPRVREGEVMD